MKPFQNLVFEGNEFDSEKNYGKFVLAPLERGFGVTIGNALRRVLISSIEGASVFAVTIEGAMHEFTALDGVVEDVTGIVLNLKSLVVTIDTEVDDSVKVLSLDVIKNGFKVIEEEEKANLNAHAGDPEADEIDALVAERTLAKKNKDWAKADEIRNKLTERGIVIIDTPNGPTWKRQ